MGKNKAGGIPPRREVLRTSTGILEMNLSGVHGECGERVDSEWGGRSRWVSASRRSK